jgi:1,4-alpha-glucan branching enzyme
MRNSTAKKHSTSALEFKTAAEPANTKVQVFRFRAPESTIGLLAGDFTNWQEEPIPMKRSLEGVWEAGISLAPGTYHYRFIADGMWKNDPKHLLNAPNQFGGQNAVRVVD